MVFNVERTVQFLSVRGNLWKNNVQKSLVHQQRPEQLLLFHCPLAAIWQSGRQCLPFCCSCCQGTWPSRSQEDACEGLGSERKVFQNLGVILHMLSKPLALKQEENGGEKEAPREQQKSRHHSQRGWDREAVCYWGVLNRKVLWVIGFLWSQKGQISSYILF